MSFPTQDATLKRTLGPFMLWGMGVGYVISGMYFGWNLGLPLAGPYGMLAATVIVTVMYVAFVLSYAELACAMPRAGGAFVYANTAFGPGVGFLGGVAQCVEFVFAPPAIAAAIGAYFTIFFPQFSAMSIAIVAYLIFTGLNIFGVKQSAVFELGVTFLAVGELLLFGGITLPHFSWEAFSSNALPSGWLGVFPALPYAIWFYLAIEGVANVAEETVNPQKEIIRGFSTSIVTLVVLAFLTLFASVGVAGWEAVVYKLGSGEPSDSPLPLALGRVVGEAHPFYHLLIGIGLCGLVASFHGIILCAGRATFEFGRVGYAPRIFGKILPKRQTPAAALILNMFIGFGALLTGKTSEIITISVFGALTLYGVAMLSLLKLRKDQPEMARPYRTPLYPFLPVVALAISVICLISMTYFNPKVALIYGGLLGVSYVWYAFGISKSAKEAVRQPA